MRSRQVVAGLVGLSVLTVWLYALGHRLPYMDQIPVFDSDSITAEARMWARMWWDEGPLKMWFTTPRAPLSIETPTMVERNPYDSWPTGAFVPIYLVAKFLGTAPSIPMVNWINVVQHGLIALTASFIAYQLALMNRLGALSCGLIALGAAFPILLSRGLVYCFSQIYDVVTAVLIFTTIFLLLEVMYYGARSQREKWVITALQLITIYWAFFVDWLSYTLFVFWLLSRIAAGWAGVLERMSFLRFSALMTLPVSAFSLFLFWRAFSPGSMGATQGAMTSFNHLIFKIMQRMNLTESSPVSGFTKVFFQDMHEDYYQPNTFALIAICALLTFGLLVIGFRRARDPLERRSVFASMSLLVLVSIPFYFHMIVLYQHTYIHRWAITKAMFAYALIPFALLPIAIYVLMRQSAGELQASSRRFGLAAIGLLLAGCALYYAVDVTRYSSYALRGRVNLEAMLMWDDIGRNTAYKDVVVSPVLVAGPITGEVGTAFKLVHRAENFDDVDKVVQRVCGDFNVVLALPKGTETDAFSSRQPTQIVDTGRIRLLRFASYPGRADNCPR